VRNADLEVTRFSITPGHMDTRCYQSKMAVERALGQSGRTASVEVTEARNAPDLRALGCLNNATGLRRSISFNRPRDEPQELRSRAEKLIAAAYGGWFSMAHSGQLGHAGLLAESVRTTATDTLKNTDAGFKITGVRVDLTARMPGTDQQASAKAGWPVSKVLKGQIMMDAKLEV
jgi:organic hydroperoxide reductase OsmC/OhrA